MAAAAAYSDAVFVVAGGITDVRRLSGAKCQLRARWVTVSDVAARLPAAPPIGYREPSRLSQ